MSHTGAQIIQKATVINSFAHLQIRKSFHLYLNHTNKKNGKKLIFFVITQKHNANVQMT